MINVNIFLLIKKLKKKRRYSSLCGLSLMDAIYLNFCNKNMKRRKDPRT